MSDPPVHFRDYDPTINPTNTLVPYNAIQDTATLTPRTSIAEEYATKRPADAKVPESLFKAMTVYANLVGLAREAERRLATLQAEYLSVISREAELTRLKNSLDTPVMAWCADYTEALSGTVATLEVPGEVNPRIGGGLNIRPGFLTHAAWEAQYGKVQMGTALSPACFAWNLTMLMPWMKWMPLWRYATVTGRTGVTLDVSLAPIISKASSYLAHQTDFNTPWVGSMTGVQVEYMTCGAAVFEIGDEVIVEFRREGEGPLEYYEPFVIGFKQEPKLCAPLLLAENDWLNITVGVNPTHPIFKGIPTETGLTYELIALLSTASYGYIKGILSTQGDGFIYTDLIGLEQSIHRVDASGSTLWHTVITGSADIYSLAYDRAQHLLLAADVNQGRVWKLNPDTGALAGYDTPSGVTGLGGGGPLLLGVALDDEGHRIYAYTGIDQGAVNVNGLITPITTYRADANFLLGIAWWRGHPWILLKPLVDAHQLMELSVDGSSVLNSYDLWRSLDNNDYLVGMGSGLVPAPPD